MKWRVVAKRYKRRVDLYHRFVTRYFTVDGAEKYFNSLVASKTMFCSSEKYYRPRHLLYQYLDDVLRISHGLDINNKDIKNPDIYEANYFYVRGYEQRRLRRREIEEEIDAIFYNKFMWMPAPSKVSDNEYRHEVRERLLLVMRNKKNLRTAAVLERLENQAKDICNLLQEIKSRTRLNAKGRKRLMEVVPQELVEDFFIDGKYDFQKIIRQQKKREAEL